MTAEPIRNVAASVRQRLLNLARERDEDFQLVLSDFAIERLLYRLSVSSYSDRFVLKGAMLLQLWWEERHRATWDLDLLSRSEGSVEAISDLFLEICAIPSDDGLEFEPATMVAEPIRVIGQNEGVRLRMQANLAGARIPLQVDIGFGDTVTPPAVERDYLTLLGLPAARLLTYPREAVVAEKFEAMVTLGVTNSRMKDFYDIYALASRFAFAGVVLVGAMSATFQSRRTPLPLSEPVALSGTFLLAPERQQQWAAFLRRSRLAAAPDSIGAVGPALRQFLMPPAVAAAQKAAFPMMWEPGGPWKERSRTAAQA